MAAKKEGAHIKAIDKSAVHRICSGQVILDLATAVKELVENSLDAGATSIEIKLKDYGAESFEVADNGCGVSPENYQALTLKYHTSKISEFSDLQSLTSFGFRGEALSSLCALGHLSVVTRTKDESIATELKFDHSGLIISKKNEARPIGTTVTVSKLFTPLPVRHKEFNKNVRREYSRLLSVLHAYALLAKGVRLVCSHLTGKSRTLILKTQGTSSMRDNIITVFGTKMAACLEPLDLCPGIECRIEGFISKPGSGSGRASADRQFFYINGRPVELPKVAKVLNELYRSFNSQQYPMAVLNFLLPTTAYDVNVTPDKRKVFLHAENSLLIALKESLENVYAPDKYSYAVHKPESIILEMESSMLRELPEFETQKCSSEVFMDISTDAVQVHICTDEVKVDMSTDDIQVHNQEFLSDNDKHGTSMGKASVDTMDSGISGPAVKAKPSNATAADADLDSFQLSASLLSANFSNASAVPERHHAVNLGLRKKDASTLHQKAVQSKLTGFVTSVKRRAEDGGSLLSEGPLLKKWLLPAAADDTKDISDGHGMNGLKCCSASNVPIGSCSNNSMLNPGSNCVRQETSCYNGRDDDADNREQTIMEEKMSMERKAGSNLPSSLQGASSAIMSNPSWSLAPTTDEEVADEVIVTSAIEIESSVLDAAGATAASPASSTVCFDLNKLRSRLKKGLISHRDRFGFPKQGKTSKKRRFFNAASMMDGLPKEFLKEGSEKEEALAAAERELEKTFNKVDFKHMKVIGQFNLGFILARLNGDLFIIDQHASDEKYNFERLSKSTVLNRQPLLRPLPLGFSAAEEVIARAHVETFRKNGFDFVEDKDEHAGQRLCLSAVPFSKNITFGTSDVQELVSLLADEPTFNKVACGGTNIEPIQVDEEQNKLGSDNKSFIRPSRVRAMLASRACRSSIMIGDALSKKEMQRVLSHLSELDSPWNCPHGRPTMRHLVDLIGLKRS